MRSSQGILLGIRQTLGPNPSTPSPTGPNPSTLIPEQTAMKSYGQRIVLGIRYYEGPFKAAVEKGDWATVLKDLEAPKGQVLFLSPSLSLSLSRAHARTRMRPRALA